MAGRPESQRHPANFERGDWVRMFNRKVSIEGMLEEWHDDSDEQLANVEGWAKVRIEDGSTRVFRRAGGLGIGGWSGIAKNLGNAGRFRIEERRTR